MSEMRVSDAITSSRPRRGIGGIPPSLGAFEYMEPARGASRPEPCDGRMLNVTVDRDRDIDAGRLGELYLRHADDAVRLAYLLTGERALAEDLVQDAFVRLAGRLAHLRDPGAFHAYLRRTVVNLSNSYFRRRKVERAYVERA